MTDTAPPLPEPRTEMKCRACCGFSSAQYCWHCTTNPLLQKLIDTEKCLRAAEAENEALRIRVIDLQQRLAYQPPKVESASWITACNCGQHQHGKTTGGWYCPAHGQQL